MTFVNNETKPHSQDFFGEWRDYWWNKDFIELMAKRWQLETVASVLDVGCGIGHWGRVLAPFLGAHAGLTGIDREAVSINTATETANKAGLSERFKYLVGSAEALPFPDSSFDMVTCQTVLIHVPNVQLVLREMIRVLKPGGLLVAAEPNNMAAHLVESSLSFDDPIETKLRRVHFALTCEKGKTALGLGHNSIGDLLPGLFANESLADIRVYLSDKASPYIPPYVTPEQQANAKQAFEWAAQEFFYWSYDESKKYFLAGGGSNEEFELMWSAARENSKRFVSSLKNKTLHCGGAGVFYLVSGRKPGGTSV